jgi:hypothetical protein
MVAAGVRGSTLLGPLICLWELEPTWSPGFAEILFAAEGN